MSGAKRRTRFAETHPAFGYASRKETLHRVNRFPLLVEHQVPAALEGLEPRLGKVLSPQLGVLHRQQLVLFSPQQQSRHGQPVQITRQLGVVGPVPEEARQRSAFAIAVTHEIEVLGVRRQERLDDVEVRHQKRWNLLRRQQEEVALGPLLAAQAGGADQYEALHPVPMRDGEVGGEPAAKREADQMELVEAQGVEQVEIVHDVVVDVGHRRGILCFAEAGMEGDDDAEFLRPRYGEIDAMPDAGAVQEHQRRAAAAGKNDGVDTVDKVGFAFELRRERNCGHDTGSRYSAATRRSTGVRPRMRGITSCPSKLKFFTTFQCGMSPIAASRLKWLVSICSPHSESCSTICSAVPTATKNDSLTLLKSNPPCSLSASAARFLSSATER